MWQGREGVFAQFKTSTMLSSPAKTRRGRKRLLGGTRLNFYPGERLRAAMESLEERRQKLNLPYAFTYAYILREGAWRIIQEIECLLEKAECGSREAKKRAAAFGQRLKRDEAARKDA